MQASGTDAAMPEHKEVQENANTDFIAELPSPTKAQEAYELSG
jgi:hypothetical protein